MHKPVFSIANLISTIAIMLFVTACTSIANADDTDTTPATIDVAAAMKTARTHIANGDLKSATKQLRKVVRQDKSNADAWNLLGYSWRKLDKNRKSGKAYARALKLNPDHRGALEYQGELFIKTGQLAKAKSNLARLQKLCPSGCTELNNLARSLTGDSSY